MTLHFSLRHVISIFQRFQGRYLAVRVTGPGVVIRDSDCVHPALQRYDDRRGIMPQKQPMTSSAPAGSGRASISRQVRMRARASWGLIPVFDWPTLYER